MSERKEEMTPERIFALACAKGTFEVSWRWRDDRLRSRCDRMVRAGHLLKVRGKPGRNYYKPGINGKPETNP